MRKKNQTGSIGNLDVCKLGDAQLVEAIGTIEVNHNHNRFDYAYIVNPVELVSEEIIDELDDEGPKDPIFGDLIAEARRRGLLEMVRQRSGFAMNN